MAGEWRKSSYSGGEGGECIEVHWTRMALRDSKADDRELRGDVTALVAALKADALSS